MLDQEILSVPVIEDVIRDSGQIRGAQNREAAQDLAVNLRSGALPAAIEVVQAGTVEASLGADSVRHGLQAGAAGLAPVVAAMLLYYRWAGANATLALLLNGVLLIAALACFGAVHVTGNCRRGPNRRHGGRQQCAHLRAHSRGPASRQVGPRRYRPDS